MDQYKLNSLSTVCCCSFRKVLAKTIHTNLFWFQAGQIGPQSSLAPNQTSPLDVNKLVQ